MTLPGYTELALVEHPPTAPFDLQPHTASIRLKAPEPSAMKS